MQLRCKRRDYGEVRYIAYGFDMAGHAMALCFTCRDGKIRFISYRRMNTRERNRFLSGTENGDNQDNQENQGNRVDNAEQK